MTTPATYLSFFLARVPYEYASGASSATTTLRAAPLTKSSSVLLRLEAGHPARGIVFAPVPIGFKAACSTSKTASAPMHS